MLLLVVVAEDFVLWRWSCCCPQVLLLPSMLSSSSAGNEKYIFSNGLLPWFLLSAWACCCFDGKTSSKSCFTNVGIFDCSVWMCSVMALQDEWVNVCLDAQIELMMVERKNEEKRKGKGKKGSTFYIQKEHVSWCSISLGYKYCKRHDIDTKFERDMCFESVWLKDLFSPYLVPDPLSTSVCLSPAEVKEQI